MGERATANGDGYDKQMHLVDQSRFDGLTCEVPPPIDKSCSDDCFNFRTASGINACSMSVFALEACSSVVEYTILVCARQLSAKLPLHPRCSRRVR